MVSVFKENHYNTTACRFYCYYNSTESCCCNATRQTWKQCKTDIAVYILFPQHYFGHLHAFDTYIYTHTLAQSPVKMAKTARKPDLKCWPKTNQTSSKTTIINI